MDTIPDILLSESSLDPRPVTRHLHSKYIPDVTFAYREDMEGNDSDTDSLTGCDSYQAISNGYSEVSKDYHHNLGISVLSDKPAMDKEELETKNHALSELDAGVGGIDSSSHVDIHSVNGLDGHSDADGDGSLTRPKVEMVENREYSSYSTLQSNTVEMESVGNINQACDSISGDEKTEN